MEGSLKSLKYDRKTIWSMCMAAEMLQKSKFLLYVLYSCYIKFYFDYIFDIYVICFIIYLLLFMRYMFFNFAIYFFFYII